MGGRGVLNLVQEGHLEVKGPSRKMAKEMSKEEEVISDYSEERYNCPNQKK